MSEGELSVAEPISQNDLGSLIESAGASKYATPQAMTEVSKVGDYLPFIQLLGGESKEVKRGLFPIGHFALRRGKQMIDLGTAMIVMIIAWRPKAMVYSEKPVSYYDPNSADFQKTQATADAPKSGKGYGPEFLVWLPAHRTFATYFMGNKTGRNEAPNVEAIRAGDKKTCKIAAELIETKEYTWHGPKTYPYDLDMEMPDRALLLKTLEKFNNPKDSEVEEKADEADTSSARR
jgi:hypothetical protein